MLNRDAPVRPVGAAELAALFAPLADAAGVVLAVSGGPDSTALLILFDRWRRAASNAPRAVVATVDHGLRPEAAREAAAVARLSAGHGLDHTILAWTGPKPAADIQAAARAARYRLLAGLARRRGCDVVVTAHHLDDQAETLLLRLAGGSGVDGLAAMAPARPLEPGVTLRRPLLGIPRARLAATLANAGVAAHDDPSNTDRRFGRVRMRALMPALAAEGMTSARLAATARRAARATAALDATTDALAARALLLHPGGFAQIDAAALMRAPEEIALRLILRAVAAAAPPSPYGPRLDRLEAVVAALAGGGPLRRTLAGAIVERRGQTVWIYREAGRAASEDLLLAPGECGLWADRFRASIGTDAGARVRIAALGPGARRFAGREVARTPAAALAGVPAAFVDGAAVAVPALGFYSSPAWEAAVSIAPLAVP